MVLGQHRDAVLGVAVSPDASYAATASFDRTLALWPLPRDVHQPPAPPARLTHDDGVLCCAVSPTADHVAAGCDGRQTVVWDARLRNRVAVLGLRGAGHVFDVAFLTEEVLVCAMSDRTAAVWDWASGTCTGTLSGHQQIPYPHAFSYDARLMRVDCTRDGNTVVTAAADSGR